MSRELQQLTAALDAAVLALNKAVNAAQLVVPGATLYLESGGTLYAMRPEPASHQSGDTTTTQRQALILARSSTVARCDVGAW